MSGSDRSAPGPALAPHLTRSGSHRSRRLRDALPVWFRRRITWGKAVWRRLKARPGIAHLVRAGERFTNRLGTQFAAAITYFSFLSLVPILMVGFSAAGFVLAFHPALLATLKEQVTALMPTNLADAVGDVIDQAVGQRLTVGIIGLVVAAYSGLNWMNHVREAVRAQWRPRWRQAVRARPHFLMSYVWDLVSLLGLAIAVVVTFTLTAAGTAAQNLVVRWVGLSDIGWLNPFLRIGPLAVAIAADMLIFTWVYTILPYKAYRASRRNLLIGSLAMSIAFEALKAALSILVARMSSSPSGAVFGSVIGLLLFFNLVARAFLMVAAWIATGTEQPDDDETEPAGPEGGAGATAAGAAASGAPASGARASAGAPPPVPRSASAVRQERPRRGPGRGVAFGLGAVLGWLVGRRSRRADRR